MRMLATPSGNKTSSSQITAQPSFFMGIDVISPSTGTAVLTVYDSEDSNVSGKLELMTLEVDAGIPSVNHEVHHAVVANRGIYVSLSGTATYNVRFSL